MTKLTILISDSSDELSIKQEVEVSAFDLYSIVKKSLLNIGKEEVVEEKEIKEEPKKTFVLPIEARVPIISEVPKTRKKKEKHIMLSKEEWNLICSEIDGGRMTRKGAIIKYGVSYANIYLKMKEYKENKYSVKTGGWYKTLLK